jgi:hypothetical protein
MPSALVSTPGAANANSYVSLTFAAALISDAVNRTAWPADADAQTQALIEATRLIDLSFNWNGYKSDEDQSLDWPRTSVYDKNGMYVSESTIPNSVQIATVEVAYRLVVAGGVEQPSDSASEVKIGPINIKLNPANDVEVFDPYVMALLSQFGKRIVQNPHAAHNVTVLRR